MRATRAVLVLLFATVLAACSPSEEAKAPESEQQSEGASASPKPAPAEPVAREEAPARETAELGGYDSGSSGGSYPDIAPGAGPPDMSAGQGAPPPAVMPPAAAADPIPQPVAPPAAGDPPETSARPPKKKNGHGGSKVLSYFQKGRTRIDTARAFGFVLIPKVAVSDAEKSVQKAFCTTMLASMDFMTPSAVAASAPTEVLATFWPIVGSRESFEIKDAFTNRNCDELIAWYDHALARTLAAKAGVGELSGPLLITWPTTGAEGDTARDPLIVDFSNANQERAKKALQYWFRQVKARPELWTNRIREGTIRAELADAVNDTAGVVLSVLAGKWDSLTVVASAP